MISCLTSQDADVFGLLHPRTWVTNNTHYNFGHPNLVYRPTMAVRLSSLKRVSKFDSHSSHITVTQSCAAISHFYYSNSFFFLPCSKLNQTLAMRPTVSHPSDSSLQRASAPNRAPPANHSIAQPPLSAASKSFLDKQPKSSSSKVSRHMT